MNYCCGPSNPKSFPQFCVSCERGEKCWCLSRSTSLEKAEVLTRKLKRQLGSLWGDLQEHPAATLGPWCRCGAFLKTASSDMERMREMSTHNNPVWKQACVQRDLDHPPGPGVLQKTARSAAICWAEPGETASEAAGPEPTPQPSEAKDWRTKERSHKQVESQTENKKKEGSETDETRTIVAKSQIYWSTVCCLLFSLTLGTCFK